MDYLTPSFVSLLACFAPCFRKEVQTLFYHLTLGWIICLGRRTISRLYETTHADDQQSHCPTFRFFNSASWNWDELCRIHLANFLALCVPGCRVWLVLDDTLCHKRGAKVAFGGIFLDAVLSSKRHKVFRFGTNWVTLGLLIQLPFRKDRFFCVNILWRVYAKKDKSNAAGHRTKLQLAREMLELVASWLPQRQLVTVADSFYMGKNLLKGLPEQVAAIGPIHWKAQLTAPLPPTRDKRRKKGEPLSSPKEAMEDGRWSWQQLCLSHRKGEKLLQVKELGPCCWYDVAGSRPLRVVLIHDPEGKWRDEALLSMDLGLSVAEVILAYMRRWSVEVAYFESKQLLGLHDPMVWSAAAVERAHPMAWFVGGMVVQWYVVEGQQHEQARRNRPWYSKKVEPTFADMLSSCRLYVWKSWLECEPERREEKLAWLLEYVSTAA